VPPIKNKKNASQIMTTTEFESSQAISMDTWKTACAITESEQEAEDLVQDIF
tara:strand:+ start:174 stop:329 length:156 start_codon:yes stop_codon:yes gene_type:complete